MLLKKRPPEWVNKTAEGIAQHNRINYAQMKAGQEALYSYQMAIAPGRDILEVTEELPGESAFKSTFASTFVLAWEQGWERGKHKVTECREDEGEDREEIRYNLENGVLLF